MLDPTVHHKTVREKKGSERAVTFTRIRPAGLEGGSVPHAIAYARCHSRRLTNRA
jgi:hypothetical protein